MIPLFMFSTSMSSQLLVSSTLLTQITDLIAISSKVLWENESEVHWCSYSVVFVGR